MNFWDTTSRWVQMWLNARIAGSTCRAVCSSMMMSSVQSAVRNSKRINVRVYPWNRCQSCCFLLKIAYNRVVRSFQNCISATRTKVFVLVQLWLPNRTGFSDVRLPKADSVPTFASLQSESRLSGTNVGIGVSTDTKWRVGKIRLGLVNFRFVRIYRAIEQAKIENRPGA